MTKPKATKPIDRCVYCAYVHDLGPHGHAAPAPLAVEVVDTPSGPRPLCAKHARDAVRIET